MSNRAITVSFMKRGSYLHKAYPVQTHRRDKVCSHIDTLLDGISVSYVATFSVAMAGFIIKYAVVGPSQHVKTL